MTVRDLFPVHAGFLPLLDSALLVVAANCGFAEAQGIDLRLTRETSWANIRDRMAVGHFEVAHMLAPMPIAAALGFSPMPLDLIAPMALGTGGNAVTVSNDLHREMTIEDAGPMLDPITSGIALARVIKDRKSDKNRKPVFAVVHPYSGHNYELRYWLAANGIVPDRDVDLVIVPPPLMADALRAGRIDGYCVGEPWNSLAVNMGVGRIVTTKSRIWRGSPEKVLGVSVTFANHHPEILDRLLCALVLAAQWCGNKDNHDELANLLSGRDYIGIDALHMLPALDGTLSGKEVNSDENVPRGNGAFFEPLEQAATFPWKSHALWFYSQMVRWGQVIWNPDHVKQVANVYRPDLYRAALSTLDIPLPSAASKVEGALKEMTPVGSVKGRLFLGPDGFFDGQVFDPDAIEEYIALQNRS